MRFCELLVTCCSACFELENDAPYYAPEGYRVLLDGAPVGGERWENVFSLFNLAPGRAYTVSVEPGGFSYAFRTREESACLPVSDFGAQGDGVADDTRAVQAAVDACPPGGRVRLGVGVYRVGPILLKSHMTLEVPAGATLLGSADERDYPILPAMAGTDAQGAPLIVSAWEGRPHASRQSLLSAQRAEDITIVGEGLLDGNAQNGPWWTAPKARPEGRPRMLFCNACRQVALHGLCVANSPAWNLHPYRCEDVDFLDIRVISPKDSPNTDGCDPESCDKVRIIGARFSVGDDAIAIKSGKAVPGEICFPPASRHVIRNCLMEFAHGAVVLGSESSGGVKDLTVRQCLFINTDRGLRIKTRRGRGKHGVIDGVTFENIVMRGVKTPLVINMFYFCDPDGHSEAVQTRAPRPVDDGTPYMGRFCFRKLTCTDCHAAAGFFFGLPERPVGEVRIEDASFSFAENAEPFPPAMMDGVPPCARMGLHFENVAAVALRNMTLSGVRGERVTTSRVGALTEEMGCPRS